MKLSHICEKVVEVCEMLHVQMVYVQMEVGV